jgi:hypothetical protein
MEQLWTEKAQVDEVSETSDVGIKTNGASMLG